MAHFTTRVELHEKSPNQKPDYELLHKEMAKEGFTTSILKDGIYYKLPTAEYNKIGEFSTTQVLQSAKNSATKTGYTFSILVNNIYGREGYNLEPIKK